MPTSRFAQLPNLRLEYFIHGHGPRRVVLVHGFEASARIWTEVQTALAESEFTSIAINNRGAGRSDTPDNDEDYGVLWFAQDAHLLTQSLGWSAFTLVGHSMGGATVARHAIDHPGALTGLVMLNPANPDGRPGTPEQLEQRIAAFLQARRARLATEQDKHAVDAAIPEQADGANWRLLLDQDMARAPEQRLRGSLRSMHGLCMGPQLAQLRTPSLLVCGDCDDLIALPDMLDTWRKLPAGSGLHVWHGIGHSPNLECPTEFAALLTRFIKEKTGVMPTSA